MMFLSGVPSLAEFEDDTRYFEVMPPSRDTLAKGKKTVLMNHLGKQLGENMIACVDSDYDYLLQGRTQTSRYMLECPFVLQTYAYAIENYHCYAEGLHEVCVMATLNDRQIIDFPAFMKLYSEIAYPLFVWSVWFYRNKHLSEFSLLDFCAFVRLEQVSTRHPETSLQIMEKRVRRKLKELEHRHAHALGEIESLKEELKELGVYPENTYMFIQGHHIMDNVVMRPAAARLYDFASGARGANPALGTSRNAASKRTDQLPAQPLGGRCGDSQEYEL